MIAGSRAGANDWLPCAHFHVIFTIPHELLGIWQLNRKRLSDHLFRASRDTLFELLDDERYLGAKPGVIAALHTSGRTLNLHPRVHCLVTGDGRASDGSWSASRNGYLLPVRVVKALFRGKFMALLRNGLDNDRLRLTAESSGPAQSKFLRQLCSKSWNVRIQKRYAHGLGVIEYLARYLRGGSIRNRRLVSTNQATSTFTYKDHRDGRNKREVCESCRPNLATPEVPARRRNRADSNASARQACSVCGRPIACIEDILPVPPTYRRILLPNRLKSP